LEDVDWGNLFELLVEFGVTYGIFGIWEMLDLSGCEE